MSLIQVINEQMETYDKCVASRREKWVKNVCIPNMTKNNNL